MKKLIILISVLLSGLGSFASTLTDSTLLRPVVVTSTNIDTLKHKLEIATNDTLKSAIYSQLVTQYLNYDNLDKKTKRNFQVQALNYTYLALHLYSAMNDTTGLRECFNSLAKVYRSQHKYPQAKWFILQSNSLSRAKNDVPNIISSLLVLANIKMEIKDYSLAMRDLNEALKLSKDNRYAKVESTVQEGYVLLYTHLKKFDKADIAAKRRDFILDSLLKGDEKMLAKAQDSLQVKKKVYQVSKKLSKPNLSRRIASI